jgi:hypothetical protein
VEFTTGGSSNIESGKVAGNLETKYKVSESDLSRHKSYFQVKDFGLTFTEKWTTDNTLNTTVDVADKLLPGLKVINAKYISFSTLRSMDECAMDSVQRVFNGRVWSADCS